MADVALIAAGCVGVVVAVGHGILMQQLMVAPLLATSEQRALVGASGARLLPLLLQFSTLCWFLGGLALIAAPVWFNSQGRLTAAAVVGAFYAFGAIGNFWGTRGRHPGWVLLAIAVALIGYGV